MDDGSWKIYEVVPARGPNTRSKITQYRLQAALPLATIPSGLHPCTPKYTSKSSRSYFTVITSASPLEEDQQSTAQNHNQLDTFPRPYFAHMLRMDNLTIIPTLPAISQAILLYRLVIISDGSYNYVTKQGSQAFALANGEKILWINDGPCIAHGMTMNLKRAELCGLTSALYLALWICSSPPIHYGSITFMCDSMGAIPTLKRIYSGLPLKHPVNYMDLTVECQRIIKTLPVKVNFQWLPGHKRANDPLSRIQREVHTTAKQCNKENSTQISILLPSYEIAISHKDH